MTDNNERDTHFAGAAKLLHDRLQEIQREVFSKGRNSEPIPVLQQRAIANFAYDLMEHIMLYAPAAPVPDLTQWPD